MSGDDYAISALSVDTLGKGGAEPILSMIGPQGAWWRGSLPLGGVVLPMRMNRMTDEEIKQENIE